MRGEREKREMSGEREERQREWERRERGRMRGDIEEREGGVREKRKR